MFNKLSMGLEARKSRFGKTRFGLWSIASDCLQMFCASPRSKREKGCLGQHLGKGHVNVI